jgi:mono/diheme cytochrome c family protein
LLVPGALFLLSACQQEMASQPYYRPYEPSAFYPDGLSARPLVPGTVARGHLRTDRHLFAGKRRLTPPEARAQAAKAAAALAAGKANVLTALGILALEETDADTFPFPVTAEVVERGQRRYLIYCSVCHDPAGTGHGKIVERGYTAPPSYHIERLRKEPVGHFYEVISKGYGSMPDYAAQVPPRDRWAIIAYIRALQFSQRAKLADLPEEDRAHFTREGKPR